MVDSLKRIELQACFSGMLCRRCYLLWSMTRWIIVEAKRTKSERAWRDQSIPESECI